MNTTIQMGQLFKYKGFVAYISEVTDRYHVDFSYRPPDELPAVTWVRQVAIQFPTKERLPYHPFLHRVEFPGGMHISVPRSLSLTPLVSFVHRGLLSPFAPISSLDSLQSQQAEATVPICGQNVQTVGQQKDSTQAPRSEDAKAD